MIAGARAGVTADVAVDAAAGVRAGARMGTSVSAQGSPAGLDPVPEPLPQEITKASPESMSWGQEAAPLHYEVACAIEVPGTVGSLAVSYGPLLGGGSGEAGGRYSEGGTLRWPGGGGDAHGYGPGGRGGEGGVGDGDGWAKLFVPNYDGNKIYIFSMEPSEL